MKEGFHDNTPFKLVLISKNQCKSAKAPKDNEAYQVKNLAGRDAENFSNEPVPMHLRNAVTELMEDSGYGKGYIYDHDLDSKKSGQQCMPDALKDRDYFKKTPQKL